MKERKTVAMLQRLPVILAVTAASYGLPLHAQQAAPRGATTGKSVSRPTANESERPLHEKRLVRQR
jgi:hypothetical protein